MSEEMKPESVGEESSAKTKSTNEVLAAVADKIRTSGPEVRDRVITSLVEQKIAARANHVEKALLKLKDAEKELKKLNVPDVEQFGTDDKPIKLFSKERREQRKKAEEALNKLSRALEIVLCGKDDKGAEVTDEHWNKLAECVK